MKNKDNETALHSACQYGHTPVVSLLLTKNANPFFRNVRNETALDLAAQYGRLETLELMLRIRFDLLNVFLPDFDRTKSSEAQVFLNTPLHLASRNGHKLIVKLLLDLGFNVNCLVNIKHVHIVYIVRLSRITFFSLSLFPSSKSKTSNGTALHEAAFCGKNEVVKMLLDAGIDIELRNEREEKVEDILTNLNTSVAKQTKKLIREYQHSKRNTSRNNRETSSISSLSESLSTTRTVNENYAFDHQEDLTIVDSMLDDDIHYLQANLLNDEILSESDIQCISPPPGYTDNISAIENENGSIQNMNLEIDDDEHLMVEIDCVSPSSSLFSTSVFSELASIFEDHKQRNENSDDLMIKSSNSFTLMANDLNVSRNDNSIALIDDSKSSHHHKSFTNMMIVSPQRRRTVTNALLPSSYPEQSSMSTSLNSDGGFEKLVQSNRDYDSIVSSNYSISSAASAQQFSAHCNQESRPRPPKPPRKSIEMFKAKSLESTISDSKSVTANEQTVPLKLVDEHSNSIGNSFEKIVEDVTTGLRSDSSDQSVSQHLDSVINTEIKKKSLRKEIKKPKEMPPPPPNRITSSKKQSDSGNEKFDSRKNSSQLERSNCSIEDFYSLYDQAAKENLKESINQKHQSEDDLIEINEKIDSNYDAAILERPPSPRSAFEAISSFFNFLQQDIDLDDPNEIVDEFSSQKIAHQDEKFCPDHQFATKNIDCESEKKHSRCDRCISTDSNEIYEKREISVQFDAPGTDWSDEKVSYKLITECGIEGEKCVKKRKNHRKMPDLRKTENLVSRKHPTSFDVRSCSPSKLEAEQERQQRTRSISINQKDRDCNSKYYNAYCETLKFDRKADKENPFAGLCRGGLTPAKTATPNKLNNNTQFNQHRSNSSPSHSKMIGGSSTLENRRKKTVELSETRKSARQQRNILSGRADSQCKSMNKFSVYESPKTSDLQHDNIVVAIDDEIDESFNLKTNSLINHSMITQPNNIYATMRKKKKCKSLNGDHLGGQYQKKSITSYSNGNLKKNSLDNSVRLRSIVLDQNQQIFLWLKEIGMQNYQEILTENGYDDLDFMDCNVMDDNDLIEIGIIQASHRELILKAAQKLPYQTPRLTRAQIDRLSISDWLGQLHLKQYVNLFHQNRLTELREIKNVWEIELETMLEIDKIGHRRRILYSLNDFNQRDSIVSIESGSDF
ncbi:ankyrin repeat domain containing protein 32 [Sarcoptes scabiei]|uniref:Ankyrin repeat domain containing protein 32 n=1 Tax=Sarcoptes scabiei TaxID=52283 RepID=A0A132AH25_SARSC|nr:ankyrin repeat domain containing protein 32 [Sarcoptes scabiei]